MVLSWSSHPIRADIWPREAGLQRCCVKKRNSYFVEKGHSGKVNMKEKEPLSKSHQNDSVFFKLQHWFLTSGNGLKGLTTSFSPYDIHMSTHSLWNSCTENPAGIRGHAGICDKISVCSHKKWEEGWATMNLWTLDLWGFLLLTFSIRMEVYTAHEYLLSHNHPSTLPLVPPEAAQGWNMSLQYFITLSKGPVFSLKSWER